MNQYKPGALTGVAQRHANIGH